jgi:hypothetical protein
MTFSVARQGNPLIGAPRQERICGGLRNLREIPENERRIAAHGRVIPAHAASTLSNKIVIARLVRATHGYKLDAPRLLPWVARIKRAMTIFARLVFMEFESRVIYSVYRFSCSSCIHLRCLGITQK